MKRIVLFILSFLLMQSCMSISLQDKSVDRGVSSTQEAVIVERKLDCNKAKRIDFDKDFKNSIQSLFEIGKCYSIKRNFPMAIRYFNLAIANSKGSEIKRRSTVQLALIKISVGNDQEAIKLLRKANKLRRVLNVSIQLSELYIKYGAYEKAIAEMRSHAGILDSRVFKINGIAHLLLGAN